MTFEYRRFSECTQRWMNWQRYPKQFTDRQSLLAAMQLCRTRGYEVREVTE